MEPACRQIGPSDSSEYREEGRLAYNPLLMGIPDRHTLDEGCRAERYISTLPYYSAKYKRLWEIFFNELRSIC